MITILVTAGLAGGGVYAYMRMQENAKDDKTEEPADSGEADIVITDEDTDSEDKDALVDEEDEDEPPVSMILEPSDTLFYVKDDNV